MGKHKAPSDNNKSSSSKNNQHTMKQNRNPKRKTDKNQKNKSDNDNNKINYVLAPKKILEKRNEMKNLEKVEKQRSLQKQKQKRNSAFLKRTKKGQLDLGSRMKVLYSQIQKSFESGT